MTTRRSCVKVLFSTLVCPSIWGWKVVENNGLVPNFLDNTFQKYIRSWTSLSEIMLLGTSWSRTISLKNKSTMLVVSSILWHRTKCVSSLKTYQKLVSCIKISSRRSCFTQKKVFPLVSHSFGSYGTKTNSK
jgi:hypothetical protein